MGQNVVSWLVGILFFVFWAELLIWLAKSNKPLWYSLLYLIPFAIPLIAIYSLGSVFGFALTPIVAITLMLYVLFVAFLGYTLYDQGGNENRVAFYVTAIIPVAAIFYWVFKYK